MTVSMLENELNSPSAKKNQCFQELLFGIDLLLQIIRISQDTGIVLTDEEIYRNHSFQ